VTVYTPQFVRRIVSECMTKELAQSVAYMVGHLMCPRRLLRQLGVRLSRPQMVRGPSLRAGPAARRTMRMRTTRVTVALLTVTMALLVAQVPATLEGSAGLC
jgi:hypothetical protein